MIALTIVASNSNCNEDSADTLTIPRTERRRRPGEFPYNSEKGGT